MDKAEVNEMLQCCFGQSGYGALFQIRPTDAGNGDHICVSTPYIYPDGTVMDLYFRAEGDSILITDRGDFDFWVHSALAGVRFPSDIDERIASVCSSFGVEFHLGGFSARCGPSDSLAHVIAHVTQALMQAACWLNSFTYVSTSAFREATPTVG